MLKRIFDILFAGWMLVLCWPIMVTAGIMILLLDGKPVFFIQERIGKNKEPFRVYKFRTMKANAVTGIGRILRKTGIDEMPQLWNVIKGEMSLIGPRPLTQADIDRLEWSTPYYLERWSVRPGITGFAQLSPVCHKKMSWLFDKTYIRNYRFGLDIKILFLSVAVVFFGKNYAKKLLKKTLQ